VRRRRRTAGIVVVAAAAATLVSGAALWRTSRTPLRTVTSRALGAEGTSVVVTYPADYAVTQTDDTTTPSFLPFTSMYLRPRPAQGLQAWLDSHLFGAERELQGSYLVVEMEPIGHPVVMQDEESRLRDIARQLTHRGGSFSLGPAHVPAGQGLTLNIRGGANLADSLEYVTLVFPMPSAGRPQYEVVVRGHASGSQAARTRSVALDVVSRLRLVQNPDRPLRATEETGRHTTGEAR
jgi:hypothetical protein